MQPVSDGSGNDRKLLKRASELLAEAGFTRKGTDLIGPDGNQLTIEFLNNTAAYERIVNPMIKNLERLGIKASLRIVDPAQYEARLNDYDFDIASRRLSLSPTLSDTIREMWGSKAATIPGTYNTSGISSPVVDALIDKAIAATTRDEMTNAARASTACCGPVITGSRNGSRTSTLLPCGMSTAFPKKLRATSSRLKNCGG